MNQIMRLILASILVAQTANAAQLLDLRTGEADQQSRMVLVSDVALNWKVSIEGAELVMQTLNAKTELPSSLMALKAQALGKIKIISDANKLTVRTQLKQSMRIIGTKQMPAKAGQTARWLVDLEPVPLVNNALTDKTKTLSIAKVSIKGKQPPPAPIPSIVVENTLLSQAIEQKKVQSPVAKQLVDEKQMVEVKQITDAKPTLAMTQVAKTAQSDLAQVAMPTALLSESATIQPFKGTRAMVVAIDAGHGGKDVGATSSSGALEKDLTLAMAKVLKQQIDAQPGMRAVLTRDEDFFIPLGKRPRLAREMGADIFISLHADTYKDSKISGASFYVMSWNGATSQLAKFVAAHSNSAEGQSTGLEPWNERLANDIGKLAMESSIDDSHKLADFMQNGLRKTGIKLQHSHVQAANFVVLKNIDMPSVLVEMGFISNPLQDKLLQDIQYQQKLASSIVKGLVGFVQVQPEPGVVYAKLNVVKGDSLASIAERHGTTIAYLARANSLTEKSTLKVGQQLRVPLNMSRRMAMVVDSKG